MATETASSLSQVLGMVLPLVLLFAVFYFLIIRPQKKRDKETRDMLSALKKGDKITTIGGIYGRIVDIRDDVVTIEVGAERTQLLMARWAIRGVVGGEVTNDETPDK
ncbi:MAG: preprotein translocase subunit YajC [Clostridia bacterium]|nr:preprotein translocase subunit YajC [Clostridia bacterium]